ncbi:MAG: sulfotransferase domain-containing protein [Arenicellales bacterium]
MAAPLTRPTTIEEVKARLDRFSSDESNKAGLNYRPKPSDVFIATYPKCGTTWMQQLVHCLRTRGDMDFAEITEVVPWLELSHDLGIDNYAPQKASPHAFKSHLSWNQIPKGGRYIHVTRNPEDVLVSFYRFFEGWFFEAGSVSLDSFATELFLGGSGSGKYWDHVVDWWPRRLRQNVLFLTYEDMVDDADRLIERVADFIGITLDPALHSIAREKSSAAFMCKNVQKFDDHPVRQKIDPICGLPPSGDSAKISTEDSGSPKPKISMQLKAQLQTNWHKVVFPITGLKDYQQLRHNLFLG